MIRRDAGLECALLALCLLVFAGTRPFEAGDIQAVSSDSRGALFEALLYLATTGSCILLAVPRLRPALPGPALVGVILLVVSCCVSLGWSDAVAQALPRCAQFVAVTGAVFCACAVLPPRRVLALVAAALAVTILADLAAIALVDAATHQQIDLTEDLTGAWKGLHIHKNYAGAVAGLGVLVFAIRSTRGFGAVDLVLALLSLLLLVGSASKTAMLVTALTFLALTVVKSLASLLGPSPVRWIAAYGLIAAALLSPFVAEPAAAFLADGRALTGRVELWNVMLAYAAEHPLSGAGFASFWRVGEASPILALTRGWGIRAGQGHNGYLDLLVTVGIPGLALAATVFVVAPLVQLAVKLRDRSLDYDLCFCLVVFSLLHNLTESSLLSGNHPVYVALVVGVAVLRQLGSARAVSAASRLVGRLQAPLPRRGYA